MTIERYASKIIFDMETQKNEKKPGQQPQQDIILVGIASQQQVGERNSDVSKAVCIKND